VIGAARHPVSASSELVEEHAQDHTWQRLTALVKAGQWESTTCILTDDDWVGPFDSRRTVASITSETEPCSLATRRGSLLAICQREQDLGLCDRAGQAGLGKPVRVRSVEEVGDEVGLVEPADQQPGRRVQCLDDGLVAGGADRVAISGHRMVGGEALGAPVPLTRTLGAGPDCAGAVGRDTRLSSFSSGSRQLTKPN
jgi:hypothetical protein